MQKASREFDYPSPLPGIPMLLLGIVLMFTLVGIPFAVLVFLGLTLVNPNQSKVVVLFGNYKGTLKQHGFFWVNPFSVRKPVSLRAHNFNSDKLKVNDLRGNPIEIGAVVVWRVRDTAQAAFDVENFESYVEVQTESALRHLASSHPYDAPHDEATSLRGSGDAIHEELKRELEQRLQMAGIEVLEARLSHLAYAPEIAGAMLQRQQAEAVLDARAHRRRRSLHGEDGARPPAARRRRRARHRAQGADGQQPARRALRRPRHAARRQRRHALRLIRTIVADEKKGFLLRLPPRLLDELRRWSEQDMRSINGQIEWILREALRERLGKDPMAAEQKRKKG